jgi:hypothetical protein
MLPELLRSRAGGDCSNAGIVAAGFFTGNDTLRERLRRESPFGSYSSSSASWSFTFAASDFLLFVGPGGKSGDAGGDAAGDAMPTTWPPSWPVVSGGGSFFPAAVPDVFNIIFLVGTPFSPLAFLALGKAPRGAIVSTTPPRTNPASSKLGLLCTDGSNHRCKNDREPSLAELRDTSSGLV